MLQNKFCIGQTVVVMHGKKLVEMVVDNIAPEGEKLVYELKYSIAPPKIKKQKKAGTFAEMVSKEYHNAISVGYRGGLASAWPVRYPLSGFLHNPSAIIVDDLDDKPATEIVSFHEYKEHQIFKDLEDFKSSVQLVPVFVPKNKKKKAA